MNKTRKHVVHAPHRKGTTLLLAMLAGVAGFTASPNAPAQYGPVAPANASTASAETVAAAPQIAPMVNAGPFFSFWSPTNRDIGYLFAGSLERGADNGAPPHSVLTVGAQINAVHRSGIHQIAFGIATEAWALPGSYSMLTGIEATTINREPENPYRKISMWSTFKNRSDLEYGSPPADPMNLNTQALRIESQAGTGFERGVVFAGVSLHPSRRMQRPAAIDLSELPDAQIGEIDLIRIRSDVALRYDPVSKELYVYRG
jgi:hypothetical protein